MHVVILSGGVGSRLWPVSRDDAPKPFLKLDNDESLLQKTYLRSAQIPYLNSITTITHKDLFLRTQKEYALCADKIATVFNQHYILEPFGKNTAAAITIAAHEIASLYGNDALMLVLPADHIIENVTAFHDAIKNAALLAHAGKLVTLGIKPTSPETGYGYIEFQNNEVSRFIEKPSLELAQIYFNNNQFVWNAGIFCFSAQTVLQEMQQHCPHIAALTKKCLINSQRHNQAATRLELDAQTFALLEENSIDYALMEKTKKAAVVPCDIGWSDVGTWNAIHQLKKSDENGNYFNGKVIAQQTKNCYIESDSRLISTIGVENLVIVDTPDALLVAHKNNTQDVKHIYNQLKKSKDDAHKLHKTVIRPWGSYTVLQEHEGYKVKLINVDSGASLSLQMHQHRCEHWIILSGQAWIRKADEEFMLENNQSIFIPSKTFHRLSNKGNTQLTVLEVQSGDYIGEDDIVRFDDVYGRVSL